MIQMFFGVFWLFAMWKEVKRKFVNIWDIAIEHFLPENIYLPLFKKENCR